MNGFMTMMKMNLKLLLRNKGYLSFLIILPILSILMLNLNNHTMITQESDTIQELTKENAQILNVVNSKLSIKVYDCNQSELSEYILKELAGTGSYRIYRYKSSEALDIATVREMALYSANHNNIGAVIYIPDDFETQLLQDNVSNLVIMEATEDGRIELLKNNINSYLQSIVNNAAITGNDKDELIALLDTTVKKALSKETVNIEVGDTLNLTSDQKSYSSNIGYSLAFLTIGFLFSGVFIAATVVDERQNRVYNRVVLSKASLVNYGLVKLTMVLLTVIMQTGLIAIGIKLIVKADYGIPFTSYLLFVFCLGMIFNLLSVMIGVLTNNVLTSNYIAFLIWCLSDMLAGLYFPLDGASVWWSRVSLLMPQRWVIKSAEMLMAGKSGVYSTYLLVVISFLVLILCVGLAGMRIRRKE